MRTGFRWVGVLVCAAAIGVGSASAQTPLIDAVKAGRVDTVRMLARNARAVNTPEADGTTALHWAARANNLAVVQLLIGAGANVKAVNRYGLSPLTFAATNGNAAVLEALLKAGADPNTSLPEGQSVLMDAARAGNGQAIRVLLANGANVHAAEAHFGETALIWAAAENHPEAVRALLEAGAEINGKSRDMKYPDLKFTPGGMIITYLPRGAMTPLMYAARQGAVDAAKELVAHNANINDTDADGTTALLFAIINAHFDVAKFLIEAGADVKLADRVGQTALYAAVEMSTLDEGMGRPLPKPTGDNVEVIRILLDKGADANAALSAPLMARHHAEGDRNLGAGTTPLMRAAKNGDIPVMKLLMDRGADPKRTQTDGTNAAMIAASPTTAQYSRIRATEASQLEGVKLMMSFGLDINAVNVRGETALHRAVLRGRNETIEGLVKLGARMDIKNKQDQLALDAAVTLLKTRPEMSTTVELLRKLGAPETPESERRTVAPPAEPRQ